MKKAAICAALFLAVAQSKKLRQEEEEVEEIEEEPEVIAEAPEEE